MPHGLLVDLPANHEKEKRGSLWSKKMFDIWGVGPGPAPPPPPVPTPMKGDSHPERGTPRTTLAVYLGLEL